MTGLDDALKALWVETQECLHPDCKYPTSLQDLNGQYSGNSHGRRIKMQSLNNGINAPQSPVMAPLIKPGLRSTAEAPV